MLLKYMHYLKVLSVQGIYNMIIKKLAKVLKFFVVRIGYESYTLF